MKTNRAIFQKTAIALLAATALNLSFVDTAKSRDTDIYFSNPSAATLAIKPNVMVIIDTSGSMVDNNVSPGVTRLQAMKDAFNTILDDPNTKNVKMGLMRFSGTNAGPVLFPVSDLDMPAEKVEGNGILSIESGLSASTDDAEQNAASGAMNLTSTTLDMTRTGGTEQFVGYRFTNVSVPKGVKVTGAYIIFEAKNSDAGGTSAIRIKAQDSSAPATFAGTAFDIRDRTIAATNSVDWVPTAWTAGEKESTSDLSSIVQPIVDRSDWCGGSSMLFTMQARDVATNIQRRAVSFDDTPTQAPVLVIQYDPTTIPAGSCLSKGGVQVRVNTGNDDAEERVSNGAITRNNAQLNLTNRSGNNQLVGMRFQNVTIPAGAVINSAFLDFTVDTTNSATANLTIQGQKTANPGGFLTTASNISSRARTTASVAWNGVANPAVNATLSSPDVTSIVNEIVNGGLGWGSGNSMVMILTAGNSNNGPRIVEAYEGSTTKAPVLRVSYQVNATATTIPTLTVRDRLKQIVNGLQASGNTPIVDSLWEAGLYYRGRDALYGLKRGDQSGDDARYTRVSHFASYTGGGGVYRDPACSDANLNATACQTEEITGNPTYVSPFESGCQNSYIVLLTDGTPNGNNSKALVQSLTGSTCANSIAGGSGDCSNELVKYFYDNNLSGFVDKHNIVTHTVGFGDGVTSATDIAYLKEIAANGNGSFNTAGDAAELVTAFQQILAKVNSNPTAFVSPSLSVNAFNKLFSRDEVYFSLFAPQTSVRWPGNVKKFKLCNDTTNATCTFGDVLDAPNPTISPAIGTNSKILTTADSYWTTGADLPDGPTIQKGGAGQQVPASGSRNVYTYTGTSDNPGSVNLSLAAHAVNATNVTKTMLGDSTMTDARRDSIIAWMRGQDAADEDGDCLAGALASNACYTEKRWAFADALHSRPLTVNYGGTLANPVIKIFVGTNDGGLRMLNTSDGSNGGKEEWIVYVPEFLSKQGDLMDNATGQHIEGMDGTPSVYAIDNDNDGIIEPGGTDNDKVYLYIGQRRGGRNIYAFDVTPPSALTDPNQIGQIQPKYMWRIKGGTTTGFDALGQTWSRPQVANILIRGATAGESVKKPVLIFSGGYDPRHDNPNPATPPPYRVYPNGADSMGNAIYIVDPLDGSLIWSAGSATSTSNLKLTGMDYAIPSDPALMDTNSDGAVDRIYVGDLHGQVWRIDLSDQIVPGTSADTASKGHMFANLGIAGTRQQNRKFFFPPDIAQVADTVYSSVENYDILTIESGDREDPLDKLTAQIPPSPGEEPVHNRVYALRDYYWQTGPLAAKPAEWPLTEAGSLMDVSDKLTTFSTADITAMQASKGWYIRLKNSAAPIWSGEKGLAKPIIFEGKIFFTTFLPAAAVAPPPGTCAPLSEGTGRFYAVDYLTGLPVYDYNNDGNLERATDVGGGIPSEAVIVIREGGVTALVGTSGGAARPNVDLNLPRYNTYWFQE